MKLFDLSPNQEKIIQKVSSRCISSCTLLHPLDSKQMTECAESCSEQNRSLFKMSNASSYASLGALLILVVIIVVVIRNK